MRKRIRCEARRPGVRVDGRAGGRGVREAVMALLAALATALAASSTAHAARFQAPCVAGTTAPSCSYWMARTTFVADGDTIRVIVDGERGEKTIRFTGINAMELTGATARTPPTGAARAWASRRPRSWTGPSRPSHGIVRLSAQDPRQPQRQAPAALGRGPRRRPLAVTSARLELEQGLALWLPNRTEWAHNREYNALAEQAARRASGNLYDPAACAGAPSADAQLAVDVNWDADGKRARTSTASGSTSATSAPTDVAAGPAGGCATRGSAPAAHIPGFVFPSYAVAPAGGSVRLHAGCGENSPHAGAASTGASRTPCSRT